MALEALIIKERLGISNEETVVGNLQLKKIPAKREWWWYPIGVKFPTFARNADSVLGLILRVPRPQTKSGLVWLGDFWLVCGLLLSKQLKNKKWVKLQIG